jgi:hypothetical protein
MNGMKKLLSLVAIVVLAGALLPGLGQAAYRGGLDLISYNDFTVNGPDQISLRPGVTENSSIGTTEMWLTISTRSLVAGSETVREQWIYRNERYPYFFYPPNEYILPYLKDPAAQVSYPDPAWSPDGQWLAYVKTDKLVSYAEIYIQKYELSDVAATAITPVGSAFLVATGGHNRHPAWSPDGRNLVFDSDRSGASIDLYTVPVIDGSGNAAVGAITRITFNNTKAEVEPAWSPDGTKIAYASNEFGPFVPKILDLSTVPNPTDGYVADQNLFSTSYHDIGWSWVPGEHVLYFTTNRGGDPNSNPSNYRLDLDTQTKCAMAFDPNSDQDIDVSHITNYSGTTPFNYFDWIHRDTYFGVNIVWRANYVFLCQPPLPLGVNFSPTSVNVNSPRHDPINLILNMTPDETAQGYIAYPGDINGKEGLYQTTSGFFKAPLLEGTAPIVDPNTGTYAFDANLSKGTLTYYYSTRTLQAKMVALGLVDRLVPMRVTTYSRDTGRRFEGIGYLQVATSNTAGSAIRMVQNSPNPFNPQTKITFATNKPGNVDLRVFNVRGELVRTITNQWYPAGEHTVTWDGQTNNGVSAPSGMYFAIAKSNGATDKMKMMLMK